MYRADCARRIRPAAAVVVEQACCLLSPVACLTPHAPTRIVAVCMQKHHRLSLCCRTDMPPLAIAALSFLVDCVAERGHLSLADAPAGLVSHPHCCRALFIVLQEGAASATLTRLQALSLIHIAVVPCSFVLQDGATSATLTRLVALAVSVGGLLVTALLLNLVSGAVNAAGRDGMPSTQHSSCVMRTCEPPDVSQ